MNPAVLAFASLLQDPSPAPPAPAPQAKEEQLTPEDLRLRSAQEFCAKERTAVLVIRKGGKVFLEWSAPGEDLARPYPLLSATQGFWGVAALAAAQDEIVSSLEEKACATLKEWESHAHKKEITLRQLLDLSCGLDPVVQPFLGPVGGDKYVRALELEAVAPPGERFRYGPGPYFVFGEILRRKRQAQHENPRAFLERRVLAPIGVKVAGWTTDQVGNPLTFYGAALGARDWALFGELVLRKGKWGDKEIVAPERMELLFQPSKTNPNYALGWWTWTGVSVCETDYLGLLDPGGGPSASAGLARLSWVPKDLIFAAGMGRRLYVIPSRELVIVRIGEGKGWSDIGFLAQLFEPRPSPGEPQGGR